MTPEERAAEKLRLKEQEEEEYMKTTLGSLGLESTSSSGAATNDSFNPTSVEDFQQFAKTFCQKVTEYKSKEELVDVLEDMVKNLCAGCELFKIFFREWMTE